MAKKSKNLEESLIKALTKKLDDIDICVKKAISKYNEDINSCDPIIPCSVIHEMEDFIGSEVRFLGIS